jgi:hypothetical protein
MDWKKQQVFGMRKKKEKNRLEYESWHYLH